MISRLSPNTIFKGLFVGNFSDWNNVPITMDTPEPFSETDLSILMEGGLINKYIRGEGSGKIKVNIKFEYKYEDLNIRETTGENL